MAKKIIDCGLLTSNEKVIDRFQAVADEFGFSFQVWSHLDALMAEEDTGCRVIAYFCESDGEKNLTQKMSEIAQGVSFTFTDSFQFAIIEKPLSKEDTALIKKCGVASLLTINELEETSKLEFIVTQLIRSQYIPIKESDLVPDIPIAFHLFHLMPLSGKFLKIMNPESTFDERKKIKMREVGEFYIKRSELPLFTEYSRNFANQDGGMIRQCRAQFLEFQSKFGELAIMLIDQSESMSYEEGKNLLGQCNQLAKELASSLSKVGVSGVFEVINNSSVGSFGSVDRAPAVAAYAAFFAMGMGAQNLEELIFSALIMDLGLVFLDPKLTKKLRDREELSEEESEAYKRFPQKSIDTALSRKMPLDEKMKKNILMAREQANGQGFPKKVDGDRLTNESQLLGFSSFFDKMTLLELGKARQSPSEAFLEIVNKELVELQLFNALFLVGLKKAFGAATKKVVDKKAVA